MQFGLMYLKTWGGTQAYLAYSTLGLCSCFFVFGRKHMAPSSVTLHNALSVMACAKSFWLTRGWSSSSLCFGQNAKGGGSVLIDVGWLWTLGPAVNLCITGAIGQQFVFSVHSVKSVSVVSTVSPSL